MCGGIRRECVEVKGPGASRARTPAVRTAVNRNRTAFAAIFTLRPCAVEFDANALRLKDPVRRGRGHSRSALQLIGTARRRRDFYIAAMCGIRRECVELKDPGRRGRGHPRSAIRFMGTVKIASDSGRTRSLAAKQLIVTRRCVNTSCNRSKPNSPDAL